jgi:hypothetical protein
MNTAMVVVMVTLIVTVDLFSIPLLGYRTSELGHSHGHGHAHGHVHSHGWFS